MNVSPTSLTVTQNQTATFYCSASGNPKPSITWSKISGAGQVNTGGRDNKLQIRNTSYSDSGSYVCTAENVLGKTQKVVKLTVEGNVDCGKYFWLHIPSIHSSIDPFVHLSVLPPCIYPFVRPFIHSSRYSLTNFIILICFYIPVPPHFIKIPDRITKVQAYSAASVSCRAFGVPPPTITWSRGLVSLPQGRTTIINGTLTIANFSPRDGGTYQCKATNKLGFVIALTTLHYVQPGQTITFKYFNYLVNGIQ